MSIRYMYAKDKMASCIQDFTAVYFLVNLYKSSKNGSVSIIN